MKNKFAILLAAILALVAAPVQAQFISGPAWGSVLTNSTAVMIAGFINTNFGINASRVFPVGQGGVQLFATVGGTNALTVTNNTLVFELVGPHGTNGLNAPTFTWTLGANGTSAGRYTTNFSSAFVAAQANTALQNVQGMRLLTATNVNSQSIWITNLSWSAR